MGLFVSGFDLPFRASAAEVLLPSQRCPDIGLEKARLTLIDEEVL